MSKNIYISPHMDDAFLSLGGLISKREGEQKIIDVFSLSKFHRSDKSLQPTEVTQIRRKEELINAEMTASKIRFLPFAEARMRGYSAWHATPDWNKELTTMSMIKNYLLEEIKDAEKIFFPIGIGCHVDHLIIAAIGINLSLENNGRNILFYEDMPYMAHKEMRDYTYIQPNMDRKILSQKLIPFSYKDKLAICLTYKSQINDYDKEDMFKYASSISKGNGYSERVFRLAGKNEACKLMASI